MNINELIEEIIKLEKEKEELDLKKNDVSHALNDINNIIENLNVKSIDALIETKKCLKLEMDENSNNLNKKNSQLNAYKNDLIKYDKSTGEDINELIEGIYEEQEIYAKNKQIDNLKNMIKNIKQKTNQIEEIIKIKEIIGNYKNSIHEISTVENVIHENATQVNYRTEEEREKIPHLFENNISDEFILFKNLELSKYTLNNKVGYSLKDFGIKYKNEIIQVFTHYNEDIEKTINYFQRVHGLCSGIKIEPQSFKNSCYEIFKKPLGISVFLYGKKIEAGNLRELLLKTIERIGIPTIFKKCGDIFNGSFKISKNKPFSIDNYITKIINHETYYIFIGGMSKVYSRDILLRIKNKLYISDLLIEDN